MSHQVLIIRPVSGLPPNCQKFFFNGTEAALARPPKVGAIKGGPGACSPVKV